MKKLPTSTFLQSLGTCSFALNTKLFATVERILLAAILIIYLLPLSSIVTAKAFEGWAVAPEEDRQAATTSVVILVDDFKPQPFQGSSDPYYYNRLNGDRGVLNSTIVSWNS